MWLLINEYYPIYKHDSFSLDKIAPRKVTDHTNKYKEDSNFFLEFINDCVEINNDYSSEIDDVWNHFKLWYENAYDKKPPPQKKIKETKNKLSLIFLEIFLTIYLTLLGNVEHFDEPTIKCHDGFAVFSGYYAIPR